MSEQCPVCNNTIPAGEAACPACGYKLLDATQSFQPLPITGKDVVRPSEKPRTSAVLRIVRGPQIETIFHLEADRLSVGRSPQCDIFLNDMTVSREHAVIDRVEGGYRISDNNSFNGVWINNDSIEQAMLREDDIVQIGAFCLMYQENPQA